MVETNRVADRLRNRLKSERERRGWSQAKVAEAVGLTHASAVAKIEIGLRDVQAVELAAFAELYDTSMDALAGHKGGEHNLAWAVSKLASNAHRAATEVAAVAARLNDDFDDVQQYADGRVVDIRTTAAETIDHVETARVALLRLAAEFPTGGLGIRS